MAACAKFGWNLVNVIHRHLTLLIALGMKKILPTYMIAMVQIGDHLFFFEVSHIDLTFRLKFGKGIFLRSFSSFSLLAEEKFNKDRILRLQWIKISPHSFSIYSSRIRIMSKGGTEVYIIRTFFGQSLLWMVDMNVYFS